MKGLQKRVPVHFTLILPEIKISGDSGVQY